MQMRKRAGQVAGHAVRRSHFEDSTEASTTARSDSSWQEEAAHLLLRSGFRPGETTGEVLHVANRLRAGRTLSSVWHAMRRLVESELEHSVGAAADDDHTSSVS